MPELPLIEIYRDGKWLPAAAIEPLGDEHARVEYLPEYVFGQPDPWPISLTFPVELNSGIDNDPKPRMPAFLYDLVPQGPGRKLLTGLLNLNDHDGLAVPLLLAGAFNPVGALRIDTAVKFHNDYMEHHPPPENSIRGFHLQDLTQRDPDTIEFLTTHAMLSAGTTGIQGAAPKFLLAGAENGLLYPDLSLPDHQARSHWLIKGPRGRSRDDQMILANEAAYLRVAAACGLDVHAIDKIERAGPWLKLARFDRKVHDSGVDRLAQESLASLTGLQGFGRPTTLNHLLRALRARSTHPQIDTLEFLHRDILNQALRNTDNHARNHAVQRRLDGSIRLTPLFDFAPMFRDPDLIPRSLHWVDRNGRITRNWADILPALDLPDTEADTLRSKLRHFVQTVENLPKLAQDAGVDTEIITACTQSIDHQAQSLARLN